MCDSYHAVVANRPIESLWWCNLYFKAACRADQHITSNEVPEFLIAAQSKAGHEFCHHVWGGSGDPISEFFPI